MSCNMKNEICGWKCTGFKGGKTWDKIREVMKKEIDCEHCLDEGLKMSSFMQDLTHGGLGTKLYDKKNFLEWSDRVRCVADNIRGHDLE